jgi:hypothetical protein
MAKVNVGKRRGDWGQWVKIHIRSTNFVEGFADEVVDMERKGQGKDRLADDDIASDIQSMILEGEERGK